METARFVLVAGMVTREHFHTAADMLRRYGASALLVALARFAQAHEIGDRLDATQWGAIARVLRDLVALPMDGDRGH